MDNTINTHYNLTAEDVAFCEEKHEELRETAEFYLSIRAFVIDNEPGTSYSTNCSLKIEPDHYLRMKGQAERKFADDLGRYFENVYGMPLRIGYRKLIGDHQIIPRSGDLLSIEDVLQIISEHCDGATDFMRYSIMYHLKRFKRTVTYENDPSAMRLKKSVVQVQNIAWSADTLFHVLCLFESGRPVKLPAFGKVPDPRRLNGEAGSWIALEGLQKVEAVRMFKNSRVDVRFHDAVTAGKFYRQYCNV